MNAQIVKMDRESVEMLRKSGMDRAKQLYWRMMLRGHYSTLQGRQEDGPYFAYDLISGQNQYAGMGKN